jgi:multidrug resistance efflux pump
MNAPPRGRPLIFLLVVVIAAAAVAVGAWYLASRDRAGLRLAGTLEANDIHLGSLVGGRVDSVLVAAGDSVRQGDRLVLFDASFVDAQIEEQRGRVAQARARLDLVRRGPREEDVARAKIEYENAESDRKRYEALRQSDAIAPQEYETAVAVAAARRETYLALERGSRPEDIAAAQAALTGEDGRLRYLERQRGETVVTSPARGVVQTLDLRPGDLVAPNQPVAVLLEAGPATIRLYVPETHLGSVRIGQAVELHIDTYPGRAFGGRVVEISSRAEYTPRNVQTMEQRADQVFAVKVAADPVPELKPGMAVTARLVPGTPAAGTPPTADAAR